MKRILCLVGSILLAISPLMSSGLAEANASFTLAGFDGDNSAHDWSTNGFFTRMEKRTGISFSFEQYDSYEKWQEAKARMFASGELPDVLFKAELTTAELTAYTESGQLMDLKPLLVENAPNLWAILEANPEYLKAITLENGKIGALPSLVELPAQNALWINQEWLTRLGLSMPTDGESLRETLRAFQTMDPNQNGQRDEVPLSFYGVWELKFLSHAFGVAVNDYNLYLDEDGSVRFFPMEDQFQTFVTYLRELYAEKLLDQNGFYTVEARRGNSETSQAVTYGLFFGPNPMMLYPYEQAKQYVLLHPLAWEGRQVYRRVSSPVTGGAFAITAACQDPAALLRWADVLYTQEGAIQAMVGEEGVDYLVDEAGRWQWAGGLTQTSESTLNDLSIYDTGTMPWLFPLDFYNRYEEDEVARINGELQALNGFLIDPFAAIRLTQAQRGKLLPLQQELGQAVDEAIARFVLGQWEITGESLAEFRDGLAELGAEEFVGIWQDILEESQK